ncbi:MAG: hypothetical protein ACTS6J_13895 [Burkholderiales bacterium]
MIIEQVGQRAAEITSAMENDTNPAEVKPLELADAANRHDASSRAHVR